MPDSVQWKVREVRQQCKTMYKGIKGSGNNNIIIKIMQQILSIKLRLLIMEFEFLWQSIYIPTRHPSSFNTNIFVQTIIPTNYKMKLSGAQAPHCKKEITFQYIKHP